MSPNKKIKDFFKKNSIFISIAIIIILGFSVYINSVNGQFVWDDGYLVKDNSYIKSWSNILKLFTENIGAGAGKNNSFYRPFQLFTYMINYSLFGLDAKGYHLTNIILHILVALSVYWLVNILYKDNFLSLLTGTFFIVHPIHTESVSYIAGRADILAGLFMLLCFIYYIKYLRAGDIRTYIWMLLSYICALLSKENSLILPVLLFLYHYAFRKKLKLKHFLPIAIITFCYTLLRFTALNLSAPIFPLTTTLFQRMPGFFVAIANYTKLLFLPSHLHMEYGNESFGFPSSMVILGIAILCSSLIYAFKKRKSNSLIFFSILWFFITLLPQSNLYPINAYMAEHWLYIPSIGFFLILSRALIFLYRRKRFRVVSIFSIVGLLAFYSCLTIRQNEYWREPISFYERTLKYAPYSSRLYYRLAGAYSDIGKKEKAIELYKKVIEMYKKIIEIKLDYAGVYYNLGNAYRNIGKEKEAILAFKKAIEIDPRDVVIYNNLGVTYGTIGKNEEAIALFKKGITIDPNYAKTYCNLGSVYRSIGRKKEAVTLFKKTIDIDPDCVEAHCMLAALYYDIGQYKLAIKHCDKTIELGFVDRDLLKALNPYRERK